MIILLTQSEKRATFLPAASQPHKMRTSEWTVWTGIRIENEWKWNRSGGRSHSSGAKALARKLAREHQIKSDFADGRAVAFCFGEHEPTSISSVCNRNGNFYELREVWP